MYYNEYKDYYAILGVKKLAQKDQIKKKFRQLALKYHPDRNHGNKAAEARFKEISEAYDVLGDEEKRAKYDRFGQYWQYDTNVESRESTSDTSTQSDIDRSDFSQYGNFEEFIDELLGRFSTGTTDNATKSDSSQADTQDTSFHLEDNFQNNGFGKHSKSISVEPTVDLTYAEAFKGTTKRIDLGTEIVQVRIPPGIKPDTRIRLPGKGEPIDNQSRDLYLNVKLKPHSFFSFEDGNLICEVPITPDEAVLGCAIAIPTPDGVINMKVPAGVSSGRVLRLQQKGWSSPQGSRTDLLVQINIVVPQRISIMEKEYYAKIRDLRSENPRENFPQISLFS